MGYTLKIGNAVPKFHKDDFPYLSAEWEVEGMTHADAPTFPRDEMTGNSNGRSPSYSVWSEFCREVGIYEVFYDERGRLHAGHPGCIGLTQENADVIGAALAKWQEKATLPPGFEDWHYEGPTTHDYQLARLMWLDWWVRWALENCETPAIGNT